MDDNIRYEVSVVFYATEANCCPIKVEDVMGSFGAKWDTRCEARTKIQKDLAHHIKAAFREIMHARSWFWAGAMPSVVVGNGREDSAFAMVGPTQAIEFWEKEDEWSIMYDYMHHVMSPNHFKMLAFREDTGQLIPTSKLDKGTADPTWHNQVRQCVPCFEPGRYEIYGPCVGFFKALTVFKVYSLTSQEAFTIFEDEDERELLAYRCDRFLRGVPPPAQGLDIPFVTQMHGYGSPFIRVGPISGSWLDDQCWVSLHRHLEFRYPQGIARLTVSVEPSCVHRCLGWRVTNEIPFGMKKDEDGEGEDYIVLGAEETQARFKALEKWKESQASLMMQARMRDLRDKKKAREWFKENKFVMMNRNKRSIEQSLVVSRDDLSPAKKARYSSDEESD